MMHTACFTATVGSLRCRDTADGRSIVIRTAAVGNNDVLVA